MTKDEYVKKLKKYYDDNKLKETDSYGKGYTYGLAEALVYAIGLAGKLDESKKVVIPRFADDWIENARLYYDDEADPLRIIFWMGEYVDSTESHYEWLNDIDNQKLLLNAVINGYEVEKEKKYRVKLPGMIGDNGQQYISRSMYDKLFACAYRDYLEQEFTKEELEEFPNWVQQLEFEEVEDE